MHYWRRFDSEDATTPGAEPTQQAPRTWSLQQHDVSRAREAQQGVWGAAAKQSRVLLLIGFRLAAHGAGSLRVAGGAALAGVVVWLRVRARARGRGRGPAQREG